MIGRLTGKVVEDLDGTLLVEVGGVGYEVTAPLGTVGRAPVDAEGRVALFVHTHVREDVLALYAFASDADRLAFRTLIGISSVGPKTAITILSALPGPELHRAVAARDLQTLVRVPGVGKKTAERLLLELKDKLPDPPAGGAPGPSPASGAGPASGPAEQLRGALVRMGFKPADVDKALEKLGDRVAAEPLPDLVRAALALLAR